MDTRTFRIINERDEPVTVVLEPWANEYPLAPGDRIEVVETGPDSAESLEICLEAAHVMVYARSGTILRALRDGQELL